MQGVKRLAVALVAIGAVVGIAAGVRSAMERSDAVDAACRRFLGALARGDVDGAYAQLSSRRRAAMTRQELAELTDHPAFRRHQKRDLDPPKQRSPGTCVHGHLTVDGADWATELFAVEEGDGGVRIQSFGLQPPANVQLGVLLPECGYWEGTRVGYSGPEVERVTPPLGP